MSQKTILVIDDEILIGELVCDYLGGMGFRTVRASGAKEGLQLAEIENPHLILLDVLMPEMSGIECLQIIRKSNPDAIVVMATAVHDENTAKQAIQYGAYDYITKPIDFQYLKENILSRIFPDFTGG